MNDDFHSVAFAEYQLSFGPVWGRGEKANPEGITDLPLWWQQSWKTFLVR